MCNVYLADGEEADRDGRVDVAAGYVPDRLDGRGHGQAEREADRQDAVGHNCPAAEEVEQHRAQELGDHRPQQTGFLIRQLLGSKGASKARHLERRGAFFLRYFGVFLMDYFRRGDRGIDRKK